MEEKGRQQHTTTTWRKMEHSLVILLRSLHGTSQPSGMRRATAARRRRLRGNKKKDREGVGRAATATAPKQ